MDYKNAITSRTGIELKGDETYWYPTVPGCCHFSETKILCFKYDPSDIGHIDFALNEYIYVSKEEAESKANEIRKIFGLQLLH